MRRLTLILSDLYLPEEAGRGVSPPPTHELPHLEWLLRFADSPEYIGDWRRWLIERTSPGFQGQSIAGISASFPVDDRNVAICFATPVALKARLDHIRLLDRGLLHLDVAERASACEEFARIFGPTYQLRDGGERTFYLSGLPEKLVRTVDPARLLGNEIGPAFPGRDAAELRRLWTEIEMWLHGAAFNAARERAGKRRISALWMWGAEPIAAGLVEPGLAAGAYLGGDPLVEALSRMRGGSGGRAQTVPMRLGDIDPALADVVAEFAVLTGAAHENLPALDARWFQPARVALETGDIRQVDIVANDRRFRIGARPQWKVWRRRQHWLARLGS